ncbi:uncharacterized protein LOC116356296 isoform X2 [Oncorhynchus kisutch]|uniref:uncharacterized protein LOC116356296 isoform X2 n=1 Tax=Oncorhynchus kisutch TaxID=8019 RepID=UPI0012DE90B6|nr:uncharacterized protein LOC116356296 isoform X2 [Oncorhynchus kisutch]
MSLVTRFNEQIEPIYVLLSETEEVQLSNNLLEPEPAEIRSPASNRDLHLPPRLLACSEKSHELVWLTSSSQGFGVVDERLPGIRCGGREAPRDSVWLTRGFQGFADTGTCLFVPCLPATVSWPNEHSASSGNYK